MSHQSRLARLATGLEWVNDRIGEAVSWFVLIMVGVTFGIVVLRYFFDWGRVWLQEIVVYLHGLSFLAAAGWTLRKEGHVRVDVFYRKASSKTRAWIDLFGAVCLLLPVCALIFYQAFPFVVESWRIFEGSKDGGGLEAVYLQKTAILVFAALTAMQGLSQGLRAVLALQERT